MWPVEQFLFTWAMLCIIPYGMYVVAFLFESRLPGHGSNRVPVWSNQSRAFVPGDALLMLFVTCGWFMFDQGVMLWFGSVAGKVTVGLVGLLVSLTALYVGRNVTYDADSYTKEAWNSPSKRYHDWVIFFALPLVAVWVVLPGYISQFNVGNMLVAGVGLLGLGGWGWLVLYDGRPSSPVPNGRQHPSEYQSIFSKLRTRPTVSK